LKIVLLFAFSSLLFLAGCATPQTQGERARFACYDARGRFAATVTTQGECERRFWTWRQVTE
jgi:hypothetical protein